MDRLIGFLKAITPRSVKTLFRRSRHTVRSIIRAFIKTRTCSVRGAVIKIGVSSDLEQYRAASYSTKEPETLDWLDRSLTGNDVFFDVGANIGLYSLYAAKICPTCRIYAFEPESQNFARLCQNIVLNGTTNITPCNFLLSDREAFDLFYVSRLEPGSALHSFGRLSDYQMGHETVPLRQGALSLTLDALVVRYGLPQPTLLKIDVDGIEEKILDGAGLALKSEQLHSILLEVNVTDGSRVTDLVRKMECFGYKLFRKSEWVAELNGLKAQNYIFQRM